MAATFTPDYEVTEIEVSPSDGGRRRKITKFALAGVAVLGVGAALTSAAWSDDVWFGGSASSDTIGLSGSTDGDTFFAGEEGNTDLVIADFVIGPDSVVERDVWVRNDSQLPLLITVDAPSAVGPLFDNGATVVADLNDPDGVLPPGETASVTVTVSGNEAWSGSFMQGQNAANNSIVVHVQGSTDLDP